MGSSIVRVSLSRQIGLYPSLLSPHLGSFHSLVSYSPFTRVCSHKILSRQLGTSCNIVGQSGRKQDMAARAGADPPPPSSSAAPLTSPKIKRLVPKMSFCSSCGGTIEQQIPKGERELRNVCTACGRIHYQNPKMVVGCLVEHDGKVLLCRRGIQPAYGLWTLPAGYMELGESAAEGAARETWEEAQAEVEVVSLFAHMDIPLVGESYIIFRARLKQSNFSPGPESLECALFRLEDIPFDILAFSPIQVALKLYVEDATSGTFRVHHAVVDKRPGAIPSDLIGYKLRAHIAN